MRAWWARWRVAARIARRDARRHRGRTALVMALVGLPVLAGSAGAVLLNSQQPTGATYAQWTLGDEAQAEIGAPTGSGVSQDLFGESYSWGGADDVAMSGEAYEASLRAALPAADQLVRFARGWAALSTAERRLPTDIQITALPEQEIPGLHPTLNGTLPANRDQLGIDERYADTLGVGLGDPVTLEVADEPTRVVTVTAILAQSARGPRVVVGPGGLQAPTEAFADEVTARPSRSTWVGWYVVGPAPVTWQDVLAINEIGSVVTSRAALTDPPAHADMPYYEHNDPGPSTGMLAMAGAVAAVVLLEAVLLIGPAFAVAARRSQRQVATLAAVGADRATLRASVLLVGVLTGLAAGLVGAAGGMLLAVVVRLVVRLAVQPFGLQDLQVPWLQIAAFAAFGVLISTVAAWLPARRASRIDVLATLGGRRAEATPGRRVPVIGAGVAAAGALAAIVGAVQGLPPVLVAGVLALELGLVTATGAVVGLAARLAPHLRLGGRLAVRDAARNRSRTAPAVAAVLAATAGAMAGAVYLSSTATHEAAMFAPIAAEGTVMVQFPVPPAESDPLVDDTARALRETLPVSDVHVVHLAATTQQGQDWGSVAAVLPTENSCPLWDRAESPSWDERRAARDDPRCVEGQAQQVGWTSAQGMSTLVDDGTAVGALGLDGSDTAAAALAAGRAVVGSELLLWPDGTAHVEVSWYAPNVEGEVLATATLPATAASLPGPQYSLILPPSALAELGLTTEIVGLVAPTTRTPTEAEVATAAHAVDTTTHVTVAPGLRSAGFDPTLLVLVGAAVLVGILATGIAVFLAAADSVPDLATLAAIGAPPRIRRRFAAGQAGVIATLGGWLGVGAGLVLGWALVTVQAMTSGGVPVSPDVPWWIAAATLVAVPAAAVGLGWLTTRSRLPAVRRVAG